MLTLQAFERTQEFFPGQSCAFQKRREDYTKDEGELADLVANDHDRAERDRLESLISLSAKKFNMIDSNQFIYLTPYQVHGQTYLPLLALEADYSKSTRPRASIISLLYMKRNQAPKGIKCICYRFDVPNWTEGDHNFFHMQFTWGPRDDQTHKHAERWISKKDPSIPLDAATPVEMFLSSVVSFRNRQFDFLKLKEEWQQAGIPITQIMSNMAQIRWKALAAHYNPSPPKN